MPFRKFLALYDLHWGFELKGGHRRPLHDAKALNIALAFAKDFKPDTIILGGDILDAGCISHHNDHKPGLTAGMRLMDDAKGCREAVIAPLEALKASEHVYILGNHDGGWLSDFEEKYPAVEGMINAKALLSLGPKWNIIEQGGYFPLGKLLFCHGDQISGGEHVAKNAVISYESSIRFGHFHSYSVYTKNTPVDAQYPKTGVSVPCMCRKDPRYGESKPNRWGQGFLFGYVLPDGSFNDYVVTIIKGRAVVNGKVYHG